MFVAAVGGEAEPAPTLYEWAGQERAIRALMDAFYDRVEGDELLAPLRGAAVSALIRAAGFVAAVNEGKGAVGTLTPWPEV